MGMFSFLTKDRRINHDFNEKDRELSLERRRRAKEYDDLLQNNRLAEEKERHDTRMYELKIEKLEKQMEYEDLLGDDDELPAVASNISEEGQMFMTLLNKIPALKSQPAPTITPPTSSPVAQVVISDQEMQTMWERVPPHIKAMVPKCNDEQIKEFVSSQMIPNADADTLNRAVKLARQTA